MNVYRAPLPQNHNDLTQHITDVFTNLDRQMIVRAVCKLVDLHGNGFEGLHMLLV